MFDLLSLFNRKARQKSKLHKAEYGYLFDSPPKETWVCLDLEMTGLDAKKDHILSIGAVKITKHNTVYQIDTANALSLVCRPPVMPSNDSIIIHGLRPVDVENGLSYDEALAQLLPFVGACPIVGFYTQMDMAFINEIAKPFLGVNLPNQVLDVSLIEQQKAQKYNKNPDIPPKRKHLNELIDEFGIPRLPAHDALNDALMTAMVFCHLKV